MKKVCSWCGMTQDEGGTSSDANITHTICLKCMVKVQQEMDEYERRAKASKRLKTSAPTTVGSA